MNQPVYHSLRFPAGLYGVTPDWDDFARLEDGIRQGMEAGLTALQLRLKTVPEPKRTELAHQLRALCQTLGIVYLINDDWKLALEVQADGVHMGRDDGDVFAAREALGPDRLIGVSCYADLKLAQRLLAVPVDYIAFGAMYASGTKPQAPPAPLNILKQARDLCEAQRLASPPGTRQHARRAAVVAIGGITSSNGAELLAAGADSLAVIGALFDSPEPTQERRRFAELWPSLDDSPN
ncbi:thiamine phosphate synthase [Orrella sp. 11846]|uniref:thiamine phosphate synthase n=1 Tax=Orrella sp. 11846 TaxID=3409913 RepID=UPI003B5AAD84